MSTKNYLAVSGDMLGPQINDGDYTICARCGSRHPVQLKGNGALSVAYIKCGDDVFLVGIQGRYIVEGKE
ncbi:MAG: hypothetical protein E6Q97_37575 [Desulfurellales bacterium]|nr:MAG: hypothetical protein E6Q97_37575 [Desulfurellales bacterium]